MNAYQNRNRLDACVEKNASSLPVQWRQTTQIDQFALNTELKTILEGKEIKTNLLVATKHYNVQVLFYASF